jgi:hypothetical protein
MSVQEQRKAQEEMQDHQSNLQQAAQMAPSYSERREYLEAVIEDELDNATVGMLRNMTSPDFILSNLKDAEINEIKKLREITLKKVFAAHPHPRSAMQGERRKQVYKDGTPAKPLDQNQKALIDQYIRGAFARVARSRDGFQQEQFGKTISASERRTADDENGGFLSFS